MADAMIGNVLSVAARGTAVTLATITVGGAANTITVDNPRNVQVGSFVDIITKATGAVVAANRQVTSITSAGVIVFSGAIATTTTAEGIYPTGQFGAISNSVYSNLNGGPGVQAGLNLDAPANISSLRARLAVINATYYTATVLNQMSYNDMVYAVRVADFPNSLN